MLNRFIRTQTLAFYNLFLGNKKRAWGKSIPFYQVLTPCPSAFVCSGVNAGWSTPRDENLHSLRVFYVFSNLSF
jgi:hypothetical protein